MGEKRNTRFLSSKEELKRSRLEKESMMTT